MRRILVSPLGRRQLGHSHIEDTDPAGVGADAGDVILERGREVAALSVVETVVVAVAGPVVVGADIDVSVNLSSTGCHLARPSKEGEH